MRTLQEHLDNKKIPYQIDGEGCFIVKGDLSLPDSEDLDLSLLREVTGYLDLEDSQVAELPLLQKVGEYLDLRDSQVTELPALQEVGGLLYTHGNRRISYSDYLKELEALKSLAPEEVPRALLACSSKDLIKKKILKDLMR